MNTSTPVTRRRRPIVSPRTAEQQQAAERDDVGGLDPGLADDVEAELGADVGRAMVTTVESRPNISWVATRMVRTTGTVLPPR